MSRVQFVRQMLPRICKDYYELEIWYTGNGSGTFDPTITTSTATTIVWQPDDAAPTQTTGTTHAFSYVPGAGSHRCKVTVVGGLGFVISIVADSDNLTKFNNYSKCTNLISSFVINNNALVMALSDFSSKSTYIGIRATAVYGNLNLVSSNIITEFYANQTNLSGSISSLKPSLANVYLFSPLVSGSITAASIAHLVAIRDLRIYSMSWNAANVDTVLLSASDAVWADADHYTYAAPALQIQSNAVPGGSAGADTTDPMTTPGSGNSNTDWEWDAGRSAHKALTGKAAIYFLAHNTGHAWIITYQMV